MSKKMSAETNALNWFEISVGNLDRARKFYEAILDIEMTTMEMGGMKMAMFPTDSAKGLLGGGLAESPMHKPSAEGVVVYLNANPDLGLVTGRIEQAGGKVTMPKTLIDKNIGYMAFFTDCEGNTIGLHSND